MNSLFSNPNAQLHWLCCLHPKEYHQLDPTENEWWTIKINVNYGDSADTWAVTEDELYSTNSPVSTSVGRSLCETSRLWKQEAPVRTCFAHARIFQSIFSRQFPPKFFLKKGKYALEFCLFNKRSHQENIFVSFQRTFVLQIQFWTVTLEKLSNISNLFYIDCGALILFKKFIARLKLVK